MTNIIYLHGFLSSPQSLKAQQTLAFAKRHYPALNIYTPQLSGDIHKAIARVEAIIATLGQQPLRFIGSSMGGFLSTYFVETWQAKRDAKAVVVNPAVEPYHLLADYMGEHINPHSQEQFFIHNGSIAALHRYDKKRIVKPHNYKVLLQTGDETLDYRLAQTKYQGADMTIEQGGDHSFVDYERHLPDIFRFLR